MTAIGIVGSQGRMGRAITAAIEETQGAELAGGVDHEGDVAALAKAAGASGRIFGRRMRRVPKSVAQTSVPLRTPTPEGVKHAARTPFSPKPGGAFRSPDGDVLRFG